MDSAIVWALERNPEIAAIRQRHGIAAAGVVIARAYPFNPVFESETRHNGGPASAGISNRVTPTIVILQELEVRHQGTYRRQGALATLSRTDWEIAYQELLLAGRVMSAFNTVLYRRQKLAFQTDALRFNEQAFKQVSAMQPAGKATAQDVIIARTEVDTTRVLLGTGRTTLTTAENDLRRQLGEVDLQFDVLGSLDTEPGLYDIDALTRTALGQRPDLQARRAAVGEAEAALKLTDANRYGNPAIGPAYELNETRVSMFGGHMNLPLPFLNTHRGDILQRQAERDHARLEVTQNEVVVRQDIRAAYDRLQSAAALVQTYQTQVLPHLREAEVESERLFASVATDFFKVVDIRRKLLAARDTYLDALFELNQARADLAIAVGDPGLLVHP
jgi:cobalt-zinc-cadmium efflux system outer membrane protein